jgi:hypothetical protein
VAATSDGYALSFGLAPFLEPSTRAGRRYAKPAEGVEVVGAGTLIQRAMSQSKMIGGRSRRATGTAH